MFKSLGFVRCFFSFKKLILIGKDINLIKTASAHIYNVIKFFYFTENFKVFLEHQYSKYIVLHQ